MCLAVPARVVELSGHDAVVDVCGNRRVADVMLLDDVQIGDFVLVHAGFAIQRLDNQDARERLQAYHDMEQAIDGSTS